MLYWWNAQSWAVLPGRRKKDADDEDKFSSGEASSDPEKDGNFWY